MNTVITYLKKMNSLKARKKDKLWFVKISDIDNYVKGKRSD